MALLMVKGTAEGTAYYSSGASVRGYYDPLDFSRWNLDAHWRVYRPMHWDMRDQYAMITNPSSNTAFWAMVALRGPPEGAYLGEYPTAEEARAAIVERGIRVTEADFVAGFAAGGRDIKLHPGSADAALGWFMGEPVVARIGDALVAADGDLLLHARVVVFELVGGTSIAGYELPVSAFPREKGSLQMALPPPAP